MGTVTRGVEYRECPLCLSADIGETVFLYDKPDKYEVAIGVDAVDYRREFRRCAQCSSLVQSGGSGRIEEVYESDYRSDAFRGESQDSLFDRIVSLPRSDSENIARIDALCADLAPLLNSDRVVRMLDVGSGLGVFPWAMAVRFPHWRIATIDPDEASCDLLQKKLGESLGKSTNTIDAVGHHVVSKAAFHEPGVFNTADFGDGGFDLVTLLHVLEHLLNPNDFLDNVAADMKDDGLLYVEMPDALSVHLHGKDHDRFNSCHYFLPSERGLGSLLGRHGLEVIVARRVKTKRGAVNLTCIAARPRRASGAKKAVLPK